MISALSATDGNTPLTNVAKIQDISLLLVPWSRIIGEAWSAQIAGAFAFDNITSDDHNT